MNTTPPPIPPTQRSTATPPPLPASAPRLPLRAFLHIGLALIAMVAVVVIGTRGLRIMSHKAMMNSHREQVEVITKLGALQHRVDSAQARQLCTAKGYQVWNRSGGYLPGAKDGFEVVGFGKSGDLCDVAMVRSTVDGITKLHVRLVRDGKVWRYEDIFIQRADGREVGLWASFIQEHPVLATAKVLKPEIQAVYSEAKAAFKGTAETIHDIATIASLLKGL